jgi:hypothetical protein
MEAFFSVLPVCEQGYYSAASGWAVEKILAGVDGEKLTAFIARLGWQSIEECNIFRETQVYRRNEHLMRNAPELLGLSVSHVAFKSIDGTAA